MFNENCVRLLKNSSKSVHPSQRVYQKPTHFEIVIFFLRWKLLILYNISAVLRGILKTIRVNTPMRRNAVFILLLQACENLIRVVKSVSSLKKKKQSKTPLKFDNTKKKCKKTTSFYFSANPSSVYTTASCAFQEA